MGDRLIRDLRVPKMNASSTMAEAADAIEELRLLEEADLNEIEHLRSLITAWADACDVFAKHLGQRRKHHGFDACWIDRITADVDEATDALRKAVGR
ncbi:hypothetical protein UFOVP209_2 [uncultured Caudovirales phage]|uniref:Uncharacterized protein n=1 Tax=uncultured Caudovirales phage TaxID=2100421 RepID=A0A6J7WLJ4_9CAUD|nr:hypothetical protein UFOVP209_2 [uncultured Caudovirales phage]